MDHHENQQTEDTRKLLRECNAGIKMGVTSIDEVIDTVKDPHLKQVLKDSRAEHNQLGDETHELLLAYGCDTKEPHPIAKGMSWLKTNVKLQMGADDKTVAGLMIDGCHMGVKSLSGFLNEYKEADHKSRSMTERLIDVEERMAENMKAYL
ncbi:MAG: hypothetical protein IIU00_03245 [Clostridia bacterium]|nr:hypothetical protein [Clostridia bacterium]